MQGTTDRLMDNVKASMVYIREPDGSCTTPSKNQLHVARRTRRDVEELESAIKQLREIKKTCKHEVHYTKEGYIYHEEYCLACDKFIGLI